MENSTDYLLNFTNQIIEHFTTESSDVTANVSDVPLQFTTGSGDRSTKMENATDYLFNFTNEIIEHFTTESSDVTANVSDVPSQFTTGSGEEDTGSDDPILTALDILLNYVYPVLVGVGVIANLFTLLIMTRRRSKKLSLSLYLSVLAVSDSLVLILDFLNNYFRDVFKINTIGYNTAVCVIYRWVFDTTFTFSAWIIVLLTFERFMAIWFPLKSKTLFSNKGNKVLIMMTLTLSALWCIKNLWAWESINNSCDFAVGWEEFQRKYSMWLTFGAYSHVPSLILLVLNVLIIYRLHDMRTKRLELHEVATKSKKNDDTRKISITILTVSFTYLFLTVPASVFYIYQYYNTQHINMALKMALVEVCFLLLLLSNHAVNFFLYVLTSQSFRQELVRLFRPNAYGHSLYSDTSRMKGTGKVSEINGRAPSVYVTPGSMVTSATQLGD